MNPDSEKPLIVIVCGPTGIGKTAAAIALCQAFAGEIVSADSMQIYRFMDIGTAKPTAAEQAQVRHHLIDIVNPDEPFDARQYAEKAHAAIADRIREGRLPLVVGGTGLYIKALTQGIFASEPVDPEIREMLRQQVRRLGTETLHRRLAVRDPQAARRIHPNDTFRVIRALEVLESTGRAISKWQEAHGFQDRPYRTCAIGLELDRETLYARIDRRVDAMLAAGFLEEVRGLLARGYDPGLKSMQSIGYRHLCRHLAGELDWNATVETLKRDTRRYAKRQMTWFRADPAVRWFRPDQAAEIMASIKNNLQ